MHDADESPQQQTWRVHCDGAAQALFGAIAVGVVLRSPAGARHAISELTDARGCGNEAEARALERALIEAERLGARALHITSDSRVVIDHMSGARRVQVPRLVRVLARAEERCARFTSIGWAWTPRHKNAEADALARAAFGPRAT